MEGRSRDDPSSRFDRQRPLNRSGTSLYGRLQMFRPRKLPDPSNHLSYTFERVLRP